MGHNYMTAGDIVRFLQEHATPEFVERHRLGGKVASASKKPKHDLVAMLNAFERGDDEPAAPSDDRPRDSAEPTRHMAHTHVHTHVCTHTYAHVPAHV